MIEFTRSLLKSRPRCTCERSLKSTKLYPVIAFSVKGNSQFLAIRSIDPLYFIRYDGPMEFRIVAHRKEGRA